MSVSLQENVQEDVQVIAGDKLVLRVSAHDPSGIRKIFVQCYQFSMASSNKIKLAVGETVVPEAEMYSRKVFEISVQIPENAALGKWGVQQIQFTNGRGYKTSFYRGQGKCDNIVFDVVPPPTKEEELLQFNSVEIASHDPRA
ncbi:MAG TPA: hypothetical protein VE262_08965 [Blastocatellia bacterium]|nr:hypothetical protein [Blastocatellia bacterium]